MRVIIMISSLAMAGTERNIVSVAPYIKAQGIDLRLVSMNTRRDSPLADEFASTGIPRFDLAAKRMTDLKAWQRFTDYLRAEKIDVIHAQDQDTIIFGALAHHRIGTPTVMSRHVLFEPADTMRENMRAKMVLTAARRGFDKVIAVSEAVRQDFSQLADISLDKIETVYNGLDIDRFMVDTPKATLREKFGWDTDARIITMVAALRRGKGHEVLFDAVPKIKEAVPNAHIMLIGDGEIAEQIKTQAQPHSDVITFLGQRTDVPELLAASDALTLPSWAEALPTVLIEAGAAGLPCVSTDVGGAKEITLDGDTGYIVPPGDSDMLAERLITLLQAPDEAEAMGQRARERVTKTFTLENQARETAALYERIASS
ncbi:MAG: glycosyltransferase family 4 protein [Chloroflexota bacterium]